MVRAFRSTRDNVPRPGHPVRCKRRRRTRPPKVAEAAVSSSLGTPCGGRREKDGEGSGWRARSTLPFDLLAIARPSHRYPNPSPHLVSAEIPWSALKGRTTLFQVDASGARGLSVAIAWDLGARPIGWQHSGVPTCSPSAQCRIHFLVRPLAAPPASPMSALKLCPRISPNLFHPAQGL